ncbi:MAG: hypothetical protein ACK5LN_02050 [Propioniciclava sp.]
MTRLILHAVGIDEFRELFSADQDVTQALRSWAAAAYPPPPPSEKSGWLDRLGPMTRKNPHPPVIRPDIPSGHDLEDIVHGRDVPPARLPAAWALVDLWLQQMAWSSVTLPLTEPLEGIDFAASLAGVPAERGIGRLLNHQLALPLRDAPGQRSGYVRGSHAAAMATSWAAAMPAIQPPDPGFVQEFTRWLTAFSDWTRAATTAGRPDPDLIALHRTDATEIS